MPSRRWKRGVAIFLASVSLLVVAVYAHPSGGSYPPTFEFVSGHYYDSWQIDRNSAWGKSGYLPNLMYESVGSAADLAYGWGVEFRQAYQKRVTRAGAILSFVQSWTAYGLDEEYVTMDGKPQAEWAWNADEMAYMMKEVFDSKGSARGDCEDLTFLCGAIYLGAGFDIAIANPPGHVALLIWLPEYPNANIYWDLDDGRGSGWIWIEATGRRNPLGWTPPDFSNGKFDTHIFRSIPSEALIIEDMAYKPSKPDPGTEVEVTAIVNHTYGELNNVTLAYSVELGPETRVAMERVASMIYEGAIPRQRDGAEVEFYVQAFAIGDESIKSGKLSYRVESSILGLGVTTFHLAALTIVILTMFYIVIRSTKSSLRGSQAHSKRKKWRS